MDFCNMTLSQIQSFLAGNGQELDEESITALSCDPRAGVRKIYQRICRERVLAEQERVRLGKMTIYERDALDKGFRFIAGVDEVGRGPLAGPVAAAAVILPVGIFLPGLNDSKKLSPAKRDCLFREITKQAVSWSVGFASVEEIDSLNILQASLVAMQRAVSSLQKGPDYILVDAVRIPGIKIPQLPIIKGDGKSVSIAAASIVAKVTRDRMMEELEKLYPGYGFAGHKGYGTPEHLEALKAFGTCNLHRKTFTRNFTAAKVQGKLW
ncbi:ribonuclease HII [Phosphitispora fastidiosa]|uniref:ribonuclease HII n=1 Tax=Phosphitispora fastidiosa TaxID=2837202 RepID=UPI001E38367D|nr:ribonuclease HII [Phosphitispora fastidiosa]MBU7005451.1 ribonuclease HII [Phosphitispora fastidiosa]